MPKETFNNLSKAKKIKVFKAAVQEFSTKRFTEASINQIVKTAGISRGSFYQYFNDKEDIFLYVYTEILKEKQEILQSAKNVNPDADVFEVLIQTTKASYKWSKAKPEYSEISLLMEIDNSEFITGLRTAAASKLREMVERDKQRGLIKPEIDPELVVEMIYSFLMREYFWIGLAEDKFLQRINDVIKIIKEGIAKV